MGKMVRQTRTHLGRLDVLCQNPRNAVLCLGHAQGTVTMWTPNFQAPVVKMLCHQQPIRSVAIDHSGMYMATSSADTSLKIWDLRTYNCLQAYKLGCGASNVAFSQKGLLAVSLGNIIEVIVYFKPSELFLFSCFFFNRFTKTRPSKRLIIPI